MEKLNIDTIKQMVKDGINLKNEVLHVVCGINEIEVWIITAYYPDNIKWEVDLKTRKEIK